MKFLISFLFIYIINTAFLKKLKGEKYLSDIVMLKQHFVKLQEKVEYKFSLIVAFIYPSLFRAFSSVWLQSYSTISS